MQDPDRNLNVGKLKSPARRHFLTAASAAGAKVATIAALASFSFPRSSEARFIDKRSPGGGGRPKPGKYARCFLRGTHILTDGGEKRVEDLRPGDKVRTMSGASASITWIGNRTYEPEGTDGQDDITPVRIARSAISEGVPHRDLYVSPWHFMYFNGYLIPAKDLVNDASISRAMPENTTTVDYFHILLDRHDVIVAEGSFAESLLLRQDEGVEFLTPADLEGLDLSQIPTDMTPCAPRVWYSGGRSHAVALFRIGVSHIVDIRDPIQRVNQDLFTRAAALAA